jgi:UrcA family protein
MMKLAKSALIAAGAFGLMLAAASAQENGSGPGYDAPPPPPPDYGPGSNGDYGPPPPPSAYNEPESVIVSLPPFTRTLNGVIPSEATRFSVAVSFHDLDLRSDQGALVLRVRVRDAARDICDQLAARFPHALTPTERCVRDAASSGLNRANLATYNARHFASWEGRE